MLARRIGGKAKELKNICRCIGFCLYSARLQASMDLNLRCPAEGERYKPSQSLLFPSHSAPICSWMIVSSCEQISSNSACPFSALEAEVFPNTPRLEIWEASTGNVKIPARGGVALSIRVVPT